ncbi:MAG: hypothetical protein WC455_25270 [Dehalococcoidia bacterium]|jgi:hypothetical protein
MDSVAKLLEQKVSKSITLDASEATKTYSIFTVTGIVKILSLWAVVTTVLSANHTDCHLIVADDAADVDLSLATGLTLSAAPVGSLLIRNAAAAAALGYHSPAAAFLSETALDLVVKEFIVGKKTAQTTAIKFSHTTSDAPSSGAIVWYATWVPLSATGKLTAA